MTQVNLHAWITVKWHRHALVMYSPSVHTLSCIHICRQQCRITLPESKKYFTSYLKNVPKQNVTISTSLKQSPLNDGGTTEAEISAQMSIRTKRWSAHLFKPCWWIYVRWSAHFTVLWRVKCKSTWECYNGCTAWAQVCISQWFSWQTHNYPWWHLILRPWLTQAV